MKRFCVLFCLIFAGKCSAQFFDLYASDYFKQTDSLYSHGKFSEALDTTMYILHHLESEAKTRWDSMEMVQGYMRLCNISLQLKWNCDFDKWSKKVFYQAMENRDPIGQYQALTNRAYWYKECYKKNDFCMKTNEVPCTRKVRRHVPVEFSRSLDSIGSEFEITVLLGETDHPDTTDPAFLFGKSLKNYTGRSHWLVGNAHLVQMDKYKSVWRVTPFANADSLWKVYPGDQLEISVYIPEFVNTDLNWIQNYFRNCNILDNYRFPFFSARDLYDSIVIYAEKPLYENLKNCILEISDMFVGEKDIPANLVTELHSGLFKGKTILDALKNPRSDYFKAFFSFMNDFPNKYAGEDFKFSEIYATWLLNNAPLKASSLAGLLISLPLEEQRLMIGNFDSTILESNYVESWKILGIQKLDQDNEHDCVRLEKLIAECANVFHDPSLVGKSLYLRGMRFANSGKPDSAKIAFGQAVVIFSKYGKKDQQFSTENALEELNQNAQPKVHVQTGHFLGYDLVYSRDGIFFATGGYETIIKIWDSKSATELFELKGHKGFITSMSWSEDGKRLLSGDENGELIMWDIESGKIIMQKQFDSKIRKITHDESGNTIALVLRSKELWLLHASDLSTIRKLEGHSLNLSTCTFLEGSNQLISAGYDKKLVRWNYKTGQKIEEINTPEKIGTVTFNKQNNILMVTCSDSLIHFWELQEQKGNKYMGYLINNERVELDRVGNKTYFLGPAEFSADGRFLFYTRRNGNYTVFEIATNSTKEFPGTGEFIDDLVASPDGKFLSSIDRYGKMRMINLSRFDYYKGVGFIGRNVNFFAENTGSNGFSFDDNQLFFTASTCRSLDLKTGRATVKNENASSSYASSLLSEDGKYYLVPDPYWDAKIALYKVKNDEQVISYNGFHLNYYYLQMDKKAEKLAMITKNAELVVLDLRQVDTIALIPLRVSEGSVTAGGARVQFSDTGDYVMVGYGKDILIVQYKTGRIVAHDTLKTESYVTGVAANQIKGKPVWIVSDGEGNLQVFPFQKLKAIKKISYKKLPINKDLAGATEWKFNRKGNILAIGHYDFVVRTYDWPSMKPLAQSAALPGYIWSMNFSQDDKSIAITSGYVIAILETEKLTEKYQVIPIKDREPVVLMPDNHYMAPKRSAEVLVYEYKHKYFPATQFDFIYNRPDVILKELGKADSNLILAYNGAWKKRVAKIGGDKIVEGELQLPDIKVLNLNGLPSTTTDKNFRFSIKLEDKKQEVNKVMVWVNHVPEFGVNGRRIAAPAHDKIMEMQVELSYGLNKIEVSCLNDLGVESLHETFYVEYNSLKRKLPDLHIIAMGVADYKDSSMNLKYSVKDGRDLVGLLTSEDSTKSQLFGYIYLDTLFNENATAQNFNKLKSELQKADKNDCVILYISGHGLLDKDFNFWYATWNVDFSKPSVNGIRYEDLESLLDSIPPRRKLLLMDACHSGEMDKEEVEQIEHVHLDSNETIAATKGDNIILKPKKNVLGSLNSFEIMQDLFVSDGRGSGASVIAASAGTSYALESDEWHNGIFTYCILSAIKDLKADLDYDGIISINELNTYVTKEVSVMTRGLQKPMTRRLDPQYDWNLR